METTKSYPKKLLVKGYYNKGLKDSSRFNDYVPEHLNPLPLYDANEKVN